MNHSRARAQVDRLFTDGLSPARHTRLRDHLRECDGCRRYYEGVRSVEDAMFAESGALNDAATARMADLLVGPPRPQRRAGSWLAIAATSAIAAAALLLVLIPTGPGEETSAGLISTGPAEEIIARGVASPSGVGLSLFRIDRAAQRVSRLSRQAGAAAAPVGAILQLGITTNAELLHLAVVGVNARGELQWYQTPTRVPPGVVDEVVGGAWKLTVPGKTRLFAVLDAEPLDRTVIEQAAAALRGQDLATTTRLPGIESHQDSVLLEVGR